MAPRHACHGLPWCNSLNMDGFHCYGWWIQMVWTSWPGTILKCLSQNWIPRSMVSTCLNLIFPIVNWFPLTRSDRKPSENPQNPTPGLFRKSATFTTYMGYCILRSIPGIRLKHVLGWNYMKRVWAKNSLVSAGFPWNQPNDASISDKCGFFVPFPPFPQFPFWARDGDGWMIWSNSDSIRLEWSVHALQIQQTVSPIMNSNIWKSI